MTIIYSSPDLYLSYIDTVPVVPVLWKLIVISCLIRYFKQISFCFNIFNIKKLKNGVVTIQDVYIIQMKVSCLIKYYKQISFCINIVNIKLNNCIVYIQDVCIIQMKDLQVSTSICPNVLLIELKLCPLKLKEHRINTR